MNEITVTIKGPDLAKWVDDIARSQIPYAMSRALNNVAAAGAKALVLSAQGKWTVRSAWARRAQRGKVGSNDIPESAAFVSTQTRKGPVRDMQVKIATPSWMIAQQTENGAQSRTTQEVTVKGQRGRNISYLAIPINVGKGTNGRLKVNAQHLINNPNETRSFIIESGGRRFLCQRAGGRSGKTESSDYEVLFVLQPMQSINPKFSFEQVAIDEVQRLFDTEFDRAMEIATATYKPK